MDVAQRSQDIKNIDVIKEVDMPLSTSQKDKDAFMKLCKSANSAAAKGDLKKACTYLSRALSTYSSIQPDLFATACRQAGIYYFQQSEYDTAFAHFRKANHVAKKAGLFNLEFECLCDLGLACKQLRHLDKSAEYYNRAVTVARKLNDSACICRALDASGQSLHALGNYAQTVVVPTTQTVKAKTPRYFDLAASFYRKNYKKRADEDERALASLAASYVSLKDYDRALDAYFRLIALTRERGDAAAQARASCSIANTYRKMGRFTKAIEFYKEDIALTEKSKDQPGLLISHMNLASMLQEYGNIDESVVEYKKALDIAVNLGDKQHEFRICFALGHINEYIGQYALAVNDYGRAISAAQDGHDEVAQFQAQERKNACDDYVARGITYDPKKEAETDVDALLEFGAVGKSSVRGFGTLTRFTSLGSFRSKSKSRPTIPKDMRNGDVATSDLQPSSTDTETPPRRERSRSFRNRISVVFKRTSSSSSTEAETPTTPTTPTTSGNDVEMPSSRDSRRFSISRFGRAARKRVSMLINRRRQANVTEVSDNDDDDEFDIEPLTSVVVDNGQENSISAQLQFQPESAMDRLTKRSQKPSATNYRGRKFTVNQDYDGEHKGHLSVAKGTTIVNVIPINDGLCQCSIFGSLDQGTLPLSCLELQTEEGEEVSSF